MIKIVKPRTLKRSFTNISSLPKNSPTICLILHQFNIYVLLICRKKIAYSWGKMATVEIFLLKFLGRQNAWQNGNFCLDFC